MDLEKLARVVQILEGGSYIGIVAQAALMVTLQRSIIWLLALNMSVVFVFAVASIISQWLPRRERRPRVLDVHNTRELQAKYSNLLDEVETHGGSRECLEMLGHVYSHQAFEAACRAVCGERNVRVSYMAEDDDHTLRVKIIYPETTSYRSKTEIPLGVDDHGYKIPLSGLGVGGFAHGLCRSVYVPNVSKRAAYLVDAALDGSVRYEWLGRSWQTGESHRYKCVISVPVFVRERGERRPLGVLNYESTSRDAFGSADFHVACQLAGLLALGLYRVMKATDVLQ